MNLDVDNVLWFLALPIAATICLSMNLIIRARGNRSINVSMSAFGVSVNFESHPTGRTKINGKIGNSEVNNDV